MSARFAPPPPDSSDLPRSLVARVTAELMAGHDAREARISQIRLWPLPLIVLCTGLAVTSSARVFTIRKLG